MNKINCTKNIAYCLVKEFKHIKKNIIIEGETKIYKPITDKTDQEYFRNDWTVLAIRAFRHIADLSNVRVESICIIGTGSGLDVIGAIEVFNPQNILLTDINVDIVRIAIENVKHNLKANTKINLHGIVSDLFKNVPDDSLVKFDIIYENLPNLPASYLDNFETEYEVQPYNASFIEDDHFSTVPKKYSNQLLSSHYLFLTQAKNYLSKNGHVICNIGGRVDYHNIEEMFFELGYNPKLSVVELKQQNEASTNIPAYAFWEEPNNVKFKFYPYDEAFSLLNEVCKYDKITGYLNDIDKFTKCLNNLEKNAGEGLELFKQGKRVAHVSYCISATYNC